MIGKVIFFSLLMIFTVGGMAIIFSWVNHIEQNSIQILQNQFNLLHNVGVDLPQNMTGNLNEMLQP